MISLRIGYGLIILVCPRFVTDPASSKLQVNYSTIIRRQGIVEKFQAALENPVSGLVTKSAIWISHKRCPHTLDAEPTYWVRFASEVHGCMRSKRYPLTIKAFDEAVETVSQSLRSRHCTENARTHDAEMLLGKWRDQLTDVLSEMPQIPTLGTKFLLY